MPIVSLLYLPTYFALLAVIISGALFKRVIRICNCRKTTLTDYKCAAIDRLQMASIYDIRQDRVSNQHVLLSNGLIKFDQSI